MAQFRGIVHGQKGPAHRLGSKSSGLTVEACSWQGKIEVMLSTRNGRDMALVQLAPHHGTGTWRILYDGPVDGLEG